MMYFKQFETKGLAHFSYMIGDGGELAVIDPMRDIYGYIEEARRAGMRITHIFETHRNEDYVSGSIELAHKTGATVYISDHEDVGHEYGERIRDGFRASLGDVTIRALHTPGHTLGHMSYVAYHKENPLPYMLFSGDCLFVGNFGRTDFYGEENLEKMTGLLYESVFYKMLPLGDQVILLPAHGAGSACGDDMDDRTFSTLGYEKENNELLTVSSKEEFIETFAKMRIKPRYFNQIEVYNVKGADFLANEMLLPVLTVDELREVIDGVLLVDIRTKEAHMGAHIPGSLYLSVDSLTAYLGALYTQDVQIVFVHNDVGDDLDHAYWSCRRMGFENLVGCVPRGTTNWQKAGYPVEAMPSITAKDYKKMPKTDDVILLDVRSEDEFTAGDPSENRINIPLKLLYARLNELDKDKTVYVLCASGERATVGTSYLAMHGYRAVAIEGGTLAYHAG